jgi:hypothetical protein
MPGAGAVHHITSGHSCNCEIQADLLDFVGSDRASAVERQSPAMAFGLCYWINLSLRAHPQLRAVTLCAADRRRSNPPVKHKGAFLQTVANDVELVAAIEPR